MPESSMFKIIGGNGVEYGPVSGDQIRQWIAEGRVNGQTLAQAEGAPDWKPISAYPEFGANLSAAPRPLNEPVLDEAARARAATMLVGPFVGLIITALCGFLLFGFYCYFIQWVKDGNDLSQIPNMTPELLAKLKNAADHPNWPIMALGLVGSAFILFASFQLRKMKNHALCIAACIVAIIPYANACCCVGVPFGIWGLIVLFQPNVKAFFK